LTLLKGLGRLFLVYLLVMLITPPVGSAIRVASDRI